MTRTIRAESEAEAELALVEFWLLTQRDITSHTARTKLSDYLGDWLNSHRSRIRATTYRGYEGIVRLYLEPNLGHLEISKLRAMHVQATYDRLLASGLSGTTVNGVHRVLNKALKQAVRYELIPRNPCELVDCPRKAQVDYFTLSFDDLRRILEAARDTPWSCFFRLAIATGMRRSELLGVRWQDVDLDECVLTVRRGLNLVPVEGWVDDGTKSRRPRSLAIDSETVAALLERRLRQKEERLRAGKKWQPSDLVFTRLDGRPYSPTSLAKFWQSLRTRLGLPRARFHDLRHAHATHLVAGGTDPKTVQERLGHATAGFTLDVYSRALPGPDRSASIRFAESLKS